MALKLRQGQVWKTEDEFVRIVHLERLEVKYKTMRDLKSGEGEHRTGTKKDFCRLIKNATLLSAKSAETPVSEAPVQEPAAVEVPAEETTQVEEAAEAPAEEIVAEEASNTPPVE
jgi:hypothetical protein